MLKDFHPIAGTKQKNEKIRFKNNKGEFYEDFI
jgi:hypothetical protein